MNTTDGSTEARKGIVDSIAGKAKEVAGAVVGNDSLAAEGQLQQREAHARREAVGEQAVADAEAKEAAHEWSKARQEAAAEDRDVQQRTAEQVRAIRDEQLREHESAETAARVEEQTGKDEAQRRAAEQLQDTVAETQARQADAARTEHAGRDQYREAAADAKSADDVADRLRAEADRAAAQA